MGIKIMNSLWKTAAYIRLSREDGGKEESNSIKNQRTLLINYVSAHAELTLYDVYVDDGYTGTNFERPEFQRMIADIENGYVDCVIVKDLSRFGRDYIDAGRYLERYFKDKGVRFIAISEGIDSGKRDYDLMLPIKNIMNEQYARDISVKVNTAIRTKQQSGEYIGAFACYGYKKSKINKNKLEIDEYAASIVRKIFAAYIQGQGKIKIARTLNKEGVLCPSEYKRVNGENYRNCNKLATTTYWTYSTVNVILHREMYIGNMVQGIQHQRMKGKSQKQPKENWIIVQGTHEPIIDRATWDQAQTLLKRRTRELDLQSNNSIFAGFLKCGDCGRAMTKNMYVRKKGEQYIIYSCGAYKRSGSLRCTSHSIPYRILEEIVLEDLRTIIHYIENIQELISTQKMDIQLETKECDAEIETVKAKLARMRVLKKSTYEDYKDNLISKEEFIAYRDDYQEKEALYEKQLQILEEKKVDMVPQDIKQIPWVKKLLDMRDVEKLDRNIVVEMINKIEVFENHRIKITYNFGNEMEHLFSKVYTSK